MAIPSWVSLSSSGGSGNKQITITAASNTTITERSFEMIVSGTSYAVSASTDVYQSGRTLTSIAFSAATWVTDIPASGGTATSANCSYYVVAFWKDGGTSDITSISTISGQTDVSSSSTVTRHSAGTLTLYAKAYGKSDSTNVTIYQAAADNTYEIVNELGSSYNITGGTVTYQGGTTASISGMAYGESVSLTVPSTGRITKLVVTVGGYPLPSTITFGDGNSLTKQSSAQYVDDYSGTMNQAVSGGDLFELIM